MMQTLIFDNQSNTVSKPSEALLQVFGVAGLVALGALIKFPLPFSPVPVTLQTFCVLLMSATVHPQRAMAGILLYLGLGLVGVPFFAVQSGATLGYLIAFALTPFIVRRFSHPGLGMLTASIFIYALGATWLWLWFSVTPGQAVALGVAPFIPGDLLKLIAAWKAAERLQS